MYVLLLLIKREHHRETVPQGEVIPREVKSLPTFVRPDRADARPDFLTLLVLTRGFAVIEDIRWSVWHGNVS